MDTVRITSGEYKGRKIATPGGGTHPMGERERLALFNMIAKYLPGARVLDAYAGSGALGIEALSRGANNAVFIEKSPKAAKVVKNNLELLGASFDLVVGDVASYTTLEKFDVILVDPPYNSFDLTGLEHLTQFLDNDGVLVLSHPGEPPELPGLKLQKTRKYAAAHLSVYVK